MGDLLFSFIALLLIYYFAQKANYLELRFYLFGGALLGLLIYLRFFSLVSQRIFRIILKLLISYKNLVIGLITMVLKGIVRILTLLMSIPYGLLRWFSLLLFRMGEALGKESMTKVKARITKTPRQ
jgi:hypothetical protein